MLRRRFTLAAVALAAMRPAVAAAAPGAPERAEASPAAGGRDAAPAPKPAQPAQPAKPGLVLYSASWCPHCRLARAYLARVGVAYREVDIDTPAGKAAFQALGGGGVPLLVADGEQLRGFSELAYDYFLARHP